MAKSDWGNKYECRECGTRFYDLGRASSVCPGCETVFEPEKANKPVPAAPRAAAKPAKKAAPPKAESANPEGKDGGNATEIEGDDDDDDFVEEEVDIDKDVAEVIDTKVAGGSES